MAKKKAKKEVVKKPFGDPNPLPPCPKGYKRNAAGECVLDVG